MEKLFLKVDKQGIKGNFSYSIYTVEKIEKQTQQFYTEQDYIKTKDVNDWFEVPVNKYNYKILKDLCKHMEEKLKG